MFIQGLHNQETLDQKLLCFPCFCALREDLVVSFFLMKKKKLVTQEANIWNSFLYYNKISLFTDCWFFAQTDSFQSNGLSYRRESQGSMSSTASLDLVMAASY